MLSFTARAENDYKKTIFSVASAKFDEVPIRFRFVELQMKTQAVVVLLTFLVIFYLVSKSDCVTAFLPNKPREGKVWKMFLT